MAVGGLHTPRRLLLSDLQDSMKSLSSWLLR